ncbi:uncharacterized protein BJX67DRAFT_234893 [Aspergillus lucknowensis]|uniref:Uncharacterized protein n=1 Tax=Aspergillus lucknowensis TaxID=176173 RepID=A0ABR4LGY8_9EURO
MSWTMENHRARNCPPKALPLLEADRTSLLSTFDERCVSQMMQKNTVNQPSWEKSLYSICVRSVIACCLPVPQKVACFCLCIVSGPFSNVSIPFFLTQDTETQSIWIHFGYWDKPKAFAVRPLLDNINGISGEPLSTGTAGSPQTRKQDYFVLPQKWWLNGMATGPRFVKQFSIPEFATSQHGQVRSGAPSTDNSAKAGRPESLWNYKKWLFLSTRDEQHIAPGKGIVSIRLQITPEFDIEGMHASTVKDFGKCAYGLSTSCVCTSSPCRTRNLDPLKTPIEEGLDVGEVLHVKDLRTLSSNRPMFLRDLFDRQHASKDIIELKVHREQPRAFTLNVGLADNPDTEVSLTFDEDDNFGDVVAVIQDRLNVSHGVLHIADVVENAPGLSLTISSWADLKLCEKVRKTKPIKEATLFPFSSNDAYGCISEWNLLLVCLPLNSSITTVSLTTRLTANTRA